MDFVYYCEADALATYILWLGTVWARVLEAVEHDRQIPKLPCFRETLND